MAKARAARKDFTSLDSVNSKTIGMGGVRSLLYLFLLFLLVVSGPFVDSVLASFGDSAVQGRDPTNWGTIIQGIFLVVGYALIIYLGEQSVL